jgi:hypothetical protein
MELEKNTDTDLKKRKKNTIKINKISWVVYTVQ